jgi:hypothetical protein
MNLTYSFGNKFLFKVFPYQCILLCVNNKQQKLCSREWSCGLKWDDPSWNGLFNLTLHSRRLCTSCYRYSVNVTCTCTCS